MDGYFHTSVNKLHLRNDGDIPSSPVQAPVSFDFATFSQWASQQPASKQLLAGAMQDYVDDRWKEQHVSAAASVFAGGPGASRVRYTNENEMTQAAQSLLMAQQSINSDADVVAVVQAASRNFATNQLQLTQAGEVMKADLDEQSQQIAHENAVTSYIGNQQHIDASLELQQQQALMGIESSLQENDEESFTAQITQAFLWIEAKLCAKLNCLTFGEKVAYIYNPLEYASDPHAHYISKYIGTKTVLFLGMNPGPFGMAQNGVPFGDTQYVRDWLKITGNVGHPHKEHPRRPIQGWACSRIETSGSRFWGFISKVCGTPEQFFRHCFVHNYCPLVFMTRTAKNIIPAALPVPERRNLEAICDEALLQCIRVIRAQVIVALGRYAADRVTHILRHAGDESAASIRVERILHPSPASPMANRGWEEVVTKHLQETGIMQYLQGPG